MKGKFIVIEGIDGCGKSTQIKELSKWLPNSGLININLEIIKNIESIVCQGESPDLTFFLEISPEESIFRRKNEIPDRIESEGIRFLEKVNEGFKLIAKQKNWKVISASQNIKTISNQIKETLLNNFSNKK